MLKAGTLFSYLSHLAQSQQQVKYVNEAVLFVVDIKHSAVLVKVTSQYSIFHTCIEKDFGLPPIEPLNHFPWYHIAKTV